MAGGCAGPPAGCKEVMNFIHIRTLMCQMVPTALTTWELAFPFFFSRFSKRSSILIRSPLLFLIFLASGLLITLVLSRRDSKDIGGRERPIWDRCCLYGLAWIQGHLTHPSSNLVDEHLDRTNHTIDMRSEKRFGKVKRGSRHVRYQLI